MGISRLVKKGRKVIKAGLDHFQTERENRLKSTANA